MSDSKELLAQNDSSIGNLETTIRDNASERIKRLRYRFLDQKPYISIERAKFYTEKWTETEIEDLSPIERVALSMKNVKSMTLKYLVSTSLKR